MLFELNSAFVFAKFLGGRVQNVIKKIVGKIRNVFYISTLKKTFGLCFKYNVRGISYYIFNDSDSSDIKYEHLKLQMVYDFQQASNI